MTVFAPTKYFSWHNRIFIENFNREKKFYVKPSIFNKIIDKEFKKFNVHNLISERLDKKINKKSNIKQIHSLFLKKFIKVYNENRII